MKKILVHTCCAPCFTAPYFFLLEEGFKVTAFWYNHNIHPYTEYKKRLECLLEYTAKKEINLVNKDEYDLDYFLRESAYREEQRCYGCYYTRLKYTASVAKKGRYDYFTTSLLFSKFQKHELIKDICLNLSKEINIDFLYQDFRQFWKTGVAYSKEHKMYRQQYCGCIYSERDRFLPKHK